MIKRLCEVDREKVLQYLYQEKEYNIFIIGDIETFGFDVDFQQVHAEIDEEGNYLSVLLFYRMHAIYYAHETRFNTDYVALLENYPFTAISGKKDLIELLVPYLPNWIKRPMYFAAATSVKNPSDYSHLSIHTMRTREEASMMYDFLVSIEEFNIKAQSREEFVDGKMKGLEMGVTYFIEEDGKIISTVATTAETTVNAMVVAVATDPAHRQKGYASMLMTKLMKDYFEGKQKSLCLFFDNPKAGAIYRRLGFADMGQWIILEKGD